jgi:Domain found in Dishevelled, Egl-10, and Pleckstrin (DEP)
MTQTIAPTAFICLPSGDARNAVRAAMMAMNVLPQDILPSRADLQRISIALLSQNNALAVIDLTVIKPAAAHMPALAALMLDVKTRKRVILTRSDCGLWATDRAWAQELGFADLFAQLDAAALTSESHNMLDLVAQLTWTASISADVLSRHYSAMQVKPDSVSPRGVIRKLTGLTAETLCAAITSHVKALDRIYHLKSYPSCFLGSEAVDWLTGQYTASREQSVALGVALQALGMLHHVAHEQAFADAPNFYRTAACTAADQCKPSLALKRLMSKGGVATKDRTYLGKLYPHCFIGAEAVDWMCKFYKIKRHDADIILNRLQSQGTIEHVTHDHAVRDGQFFYRFVE